MTRVRLWGVNCPEMAFDDRPAQAQAGEAREFTSQSIGGQEIRCGSNHIGPAGPVWRVLANIELANGEKLNQRYCEMGWPKQMTGGRMAR